MSAAVVFAVEDALVRWGNREERLTPAQAAILGLLHKRRGQRIPTARLGLVLWPGGTHPGFERSIWTQIHWLRRKLAGMPVAIESDRSGAGYELVGDVEIV